MGSYWFRHRFLLSLILVAALSSICVFLFVYPYMSQQAMGYSTQSIYKYSDMDFIAPEPSYEQVESIQGTNGIDKVFPFYMTKTQVSINGSTRTTTVLLSDNFDNLDITMYNPDRLIESSNKSYDNPILVDWQFCHETSAKLGDSVSFSIGGSNVDFQISAIYETNTLYDGGAIIANINDELASVIRENSQNNGYSSMYVSSSDYNVCKAYLITEYRPLGRLRDRESFDDEEQYQTHYDAIMSSGYANEITDFRIRESDAVIKDYSVMVWLGTAIVAVLAIVFNVVMGKRGCEKGYFTKHCVPKGINVGPYYNISFIFELIGFVILYVVGVVFKWTTADFYIPRGIINYKIALPLLSIVSAELVCLIMNKLMVSGIKRRLNAEKAKEKRQV